MDCVTKGEEINAGFPFKTHEKVERPEKITRVDFWDSRKKAMATRYPRSKVSIFSPQGRFHKLKMKRVVVALPSLKDVETNYPKLA